MAVSGGPNDRIPRIDVGAFFNQPSDEFLAVIVDSPRHEQPHRFGAYISSGRSARLNDGLIFQCFKKGGCDPIAADMITKQNLNCSFAYLCVIIVQRPNQ